MTLSPNTFIGEYSYNLDSKGRLNIPSKFRQSLSLENGNSFVATKGLDECIYLYPLIEWQKIENELRKLSSVSLINRNFIRQIARSATPSTCDKQGRITLNHSLLNHAQLDSEALIIGVVNKIEVWSPNKLEKIDSTNLRLDSDEFNLLSDKIIL